MLNSYELFLVICPVIVLLGLVVFFVRLSRETRLLSTRCPECDFLWKKTADSGAIACIECGHVFKEGKSQKSV